MCEKISKMSDANVSTTQIIPFVAGKSLSRSHNIGTRIQQVKSLILKAQTNKKTKLSNIAISAEKETISSVYSTITVPSTSSTTSKRRDKHECPVLKYYQTKPQVILSDDKCSDKNGNQSIEEIWANYMYEVERKNIIPVKCTCFPFNKKKPEKVEEAAPASRILKAKKESSTLYLEARKFVNDCRVRLPITENDIYRDDESNATDFHEMMKTKSTKMVRCMQKIKKIQERLE